MKENHWAVFLSDKADKQLLTEKLLSNKKPLPFDAFNQLKGVLFSPFLIKEIIEEEERHDQVEVATNLNRHLRSLSGGEQKKALLQYLLLQQPDFIIADNPFDNLDTSSQKALLEMLHEISQHTYIIQLINRTKDCLPFIEKSVCIGDDNCIVPLTSLREYVQQQEQVSRIKLNGRIPVSDHFYDAVENPLVQFNNVSVQYEGRMIVNNINWQINAGEFWHLTGPNGAGKTTLLSMITGDNPKGYGQDLILFGKRKGSGESVWSVKQKIGYFTSAMTDLFSRLSTVEEMVLSGFFDSVGLYIKPSGRQIKLADEWLALIGLLPLRKKHFYRLSPGQQRMVLIVRAMVKHPPLLILDEPTAGVDDTNVTIITGLINKMAAESKTAILYVSHREEEGLNPAYRFLLTPGPGGSTGKTV
ncbi:MAG: transporter [Ferruginibacter sp.]|uniref:ATP-binding cassette domain-containing protein n=1 Tax=Ferruginibacter sp. TaxID=1940288 RepID=UPI00265B010A|nr:ATP-binding cassette domain-containing protein [Ferruginibacter sp.]MDB5275286.1 transporter [Ferruginibacter sp.]